MGVNDFFWRDLLSHIRRQVLIPVVGPYLNVVNVGDAEQTLTTLIGQGLADEYGLTVSPGVTTMDEAVTAILHSEGQGAADRLYRVINDIILDLDPAPGNALRDLAAIDDLRLLVSTTPDRLLAKAVNDVRFQGNPQTHEISFSLNQCTSEQSQNAKRPADTETVVLNLFGQAASTPQYAIHEEDQLEWLHALLTDAASLPDWLASPLKHRPMLFIGCAIPDWLGRFLLRMSSRSRLSLERDQQFFFVGDSISWAPALSDFFATYCRKNLVQHLDMEPTAFVSELFTRWEKMNAARPRPAVPMVGTGAGSGLAGPSPADAPTIFISYMREDADAARRLTDAISGLGGDVWFDEQRITVGDPWEKVVLTSIRHGVKLFVPVISANTEREDEGYVFAEWTEAAERARAIYGRKFIVPVVIDSDYDGDTTRYQRMPEAFTRLHFGHAPGGDPDAGLIAMLTEQIRAMRRTNAA